MTLKSATAISPEISAALCGYYMRSWNSLDLVLSHHLMSFLSSWVLLKPALLSNLFRALFVLLLDLLHQQLAVDILSTLVTLHCPWKVIL